jgi:5-hydroxyisourate hydrolase
MATNAPNGGPAAPAKPPPRPPITCHVLDTTVGMPARGIPVTLTLFVAVAPAPGSPAAGAGAGTGATTASVEFSGVTDADGRIASWRPSDARTPPGTSAGPQGEAADGVRAVLAAHEGDVSCALRFQAREYWAGRGVARPFFPVVDVHFAVQGFKGGASPAAVAALAVQHWHVPLLLGPFNYTTYRGS